VPPLDAGWPLWARVAARVALWGGVAVAMWAALGTASAAGGVPTTADGWYGAAIAAGAAVVGVVGVWRAVAWGIDRAKATREAERVALVGPLEKSITALGAKVDALRQEVADMRADLYPREEPGPLAHRRGTDARLTQLEASVATLRGEKRDEVDALVQRLAEALGSST